MGAAGSLYGVRIVTFAAAVAVGGHSPAAAGVVKSVNGQTGDVTIAGANGVAVSQGSGTVTVTTDATPANTAGAIVSRDGSGSFSAGTITLDGYLALPNTTSSTGMILLGGNSFLHNSGDRNTFVGGNAGNLTMAAGLNSGVGHGALSSNAGGSANSAFGESALFSNTSGIDNAAVGQAALHDNTIGGNNSALGRLALTHNTSGWGNSAVGFTAMESNTTGTDNAAVGQAALWSNTTGDYNAALGVVALASNTTGIANSAMGFDALYWNDTGNNNTGAGAYALAQNTTGSYNVAVGYGAGYNHTSGDNNVYIATSGPATESGAIRIGNGSVHSSTFIAGISGATSASGVPVYVDNAGRLGTTTSSARFKEEIAAMADESDVLMSLRPVSFYYRPELDETHTRQYGLVAEEVAKVAPQLVAYDDSGAPRTVRYHFVDAMLLNEVQKQRRLLDEQSLANQQQKATIDELTARLARLEAALANR